MRGLRADIGLTRGDFTLGVALAVGPRQTVALLGPNGAGKTTALEAIAGLTALDSGRIELDDEVFDEPNAGTYLSPQDRHIGVVFQSSSLFPHLTAVDNVAFGPRSRGAGRAEANRAALKWLDRLDVADRADSRPAGLSGGEMQRVALARALATGPRLLLLDEPFAALDATARVETRRVLADVLENVEAPTLLVTHDPSEAFLLADTLHVIEDGAVVQSGTVEEIRLRPQTSYVADLVGVNLFEGTASGGTVSIGAHFLTVGDTSVDGPVLVKIHPRAISVHRTRPEGSPRNTWETTVLRDEHYGDRVRLQLGVPLTVTAEITPGAEESLGLAEGSVVWVSIKATEIEVVPQS